ncbi:hypothetical protein D3C81_1218500 [compost metagenome]
MGPLSGGKPVSLMLGGEEAGVVLASSTPPPSPPPSPPHPAISAQSSRLARAPWVRVGEWKGDWNIGTPPFGNAF